MNLNIVTFSSLLAFGLVACDGSSAVDGGVDASARVTGLGQLCGLRGDPCPAEAPRCLIFGSAFDGFCTANCLTDVTFTTNADARPETFTPALSTGDATCGALYRGRSGSAACGAPIEVNPAPPLVANATYQSAAACVVRCGPDGACPGALICNATQGFCVAPND